MQAHGSRVTLESPRWSQPRFLRHVAAAAAGLALAGVVSRIWSMEPRYAFVSVAGLLIAAAALPFARRLPDLFLLAMSFCLSFTGIEKTFLLHWETTYVVGGVSVGLMELIMAGLYFTWAVRIFVFRSAKLPRATHLDLWVFAFWLVHLISAAGAISTPLVAFEVIRLAKYALAFFYLEHNLERRHLRGIIAGILFAIVLQTGLAVVQYKTGKLLGIGHTKGSSEKSYDQYTIDGFTDVLRAEGTTFDSHALGLFMSMTVPLALAAAAVPRLPTLFRCLCGAVGFLGLIGLVASFARAGWLAFSGAITVVFLSFVFGQYRMHRKRLLKIAAAALVLGCILLIPVVPKIRQRIVEAPTELVTARVETVETGLEMWKPTKWTGIGANNYLRALEVNMSIFEGDPYFIPAHNMLAMILFELGIIGLLVFLGLNGALIRAAWRTIKKSGPLEQALAAALFGSIVAWQLEGIFDPIYVTNVTYFLLWFELGVLAGLFRLTKTPDSTDRGKTTCLRSVRSA